MFCGLYLVPLTRASKAWEPQRKPALAGYFLGKKQETETRVTLPEAPKLLKP